MLLDSLSVGHRALAVVLLLMEREDPAGLLKYCPPGLRTPLAESIREIGGLQGPIQQKLLRDEMRRLLLEARRTPLTDIHADWILKALEGESPQMIAAILRHMPGEQVRWVLDHLPPAVLGAMPQLTQTFSVDPRLVQILRRKFEERFPRWTPSAGRKKESSFDLLFVLPPESLEILFRKLGFRELALAFATLGEKWVQLIFRRLSPRDADLLKNHIENRQAVSEERLARAQSHVLALDMKGSDPEQLILETGFFVFSKALLASHLDRALVLVRKFPVAAGLRLEGYIRQNIEINNDKTVMRYQKEINAMIESILSSGKNPSPTDSKEGKA